MNSLLGIFGNSLLPPLLVMATGYLLDRAVGLDLRTLSRVCVYVFLPALAAGSLIEAQAPAGEYGQIAIFGVAFTILLGLVTWVTAWLLRFDSRRIHLLLLCTLFTNCGNYGLAVVLYAYGQPGLERGLAFFVVNSVLLNTLGVYLASRGSRGVGQSLASVFQLPLFYAVAGALVVRTLGLALPVPLLRAIELPRMGAIPLAQFLLGAQLARVSRNVDLRFVGVATLLRLLGGPAVALALCAVMGMSGLARSASVVQASMPTAISSVVLSIEFGSKLDQVGGAVLLSTLGSAVTLTLLLALLGVS